LKRIKVALAGNPNAGKTSLFNAITGAHQHVGNYPGVTVEKKEGLTSVGGQTLQVIDLPGTYSLTAYSLEELVARNFIINERPDVVVSVVDASNLERNLYLTVQLMELGVPLVIALNMMDLAEQRGLKIDLDKLARGLKVAVVPTVARSGKGIRELLEATLKVAEEGGEWHPLDISYGPDVDETVRRILDRVSLDQGRWGPVGPRWVAVKCIEGDGEVIGQIESEPGLAEKILPLCREVEAHLEKTLDAYPEGIIAEYRYGFIASLVREAVQRTFQNRIDLTDKIDRVLTHRLLGPLILLGVLYGIYEFVFWASEGPVGWLESLFGWLGAAAGGVLPPGLVRSLVVSGVIDGMGGVLGFAPLIMFMFFTIAIMEDSGYLARVAFLLDRVLRAFGLHGNSVMAMIVSGGISGGCAVPGVMATRTIKDPKARLATILTVPMMNCGAKLPVYGLLIAAFFAARQAGMMFALTLISWSLVLLAALILRRTVLKGEQAPFVMELPPYRLPTLKGLLIHTWERTWQYVRKAGTVILAVSVVMWALMTFPGPSREEEAAWRVKVDSAPTEEAKAGQRAARAEAVLAGTAAGRAGRWLTAVTEPLGFDWRVNVALVGGFAAKEVVASTLATAYSLGGETQGEGLSERLRKTESWSPLKAFTLMIFVMIYAPCFVTVVMIRRETGSWGWALFAVAYTTSLAYLAALIVSQGGLALGLG